jgi:hypothetical protein
MAAIGQALQALGSDHADLDAHVRQAAWAARWVGRGVAAPLVAADRAALAATLHTRRIARGKIVFTGGRSPNGVWLVRAGQVELAVRTGRRRVVIQQAGGVGQRPRGVEQGQVEQ